EESFSTAQEEQAYGKTDGPITPNWGQAGVPFDQRGKALALSALAGAVSGALALSLFCLFLSQYFPVFGGLEQRGEPWCPDAVSLTPILLSGFGLVGTILGALFAASLRYIALGAAHRGGRRHLIGDSDPSAEPMNLSRQSGCIPTAVAFATLLSVLS